jgi:hypothetical protein
VVVLLVFRTPSVLVRQLYAAHRHDRYQQHRDLAGDPRGCAVSAAAATMLLVRAPGTITRTRNHGGGGALCDFALGLAPGVRSRRAAPTSRVEGAAAAPWEGTLR